MPSTRAQTKSRLLQQAESVIDELMDWNDDTSQPSLTQIEDVVLKLRKRFSEAMAREVIEAQEAKQPAIGPACPRCGQEMRYKGEKKVIPRTWVGDIQFERGYYYCAKCRVGFFPSGRTTELEGQAV